MALAVRTGLSAVGIAAALLTAASVNAEPGGYTDQDADFYRLLTSPTAAGMTVWDFPLVRVQGLLACQRQDNGIDGLTVRDMLQSEGPYPWKAANAIVSAADVIYCPRYLGP
jgi:hypothetical protein